MNKKIRRAWVIPFEYIFNRFTNWPTIPNSKDKVFLLDIKKYKGKTYTLKDGTTISRGDKIAELHLNNTHIVDLDNSMANLYSLIDSELSLMAKALKKELIDVKALYCETVLYAIVSRKGFETFKLPNNIFTKLKAVWYRNLKDTLSSNKDSSKKRMPRKCFITRENLIKRFN